jgi:hypothetical protein
VFAVSCAADRRESAATHRPSAFAIDGLVRVPPAHAAEPRPPTATPGSTAGGRTRDNVGRSPAIRGASGPLGSLTCGFASIRPVTSQDYLQWLRLVTGVFGPHVPWMCPQKLSVRRRRTPRSRTSCLKPSVGFEPRLRRSRGCVRCDHVMPRVFTVLPPTARAGAGGSACSVVPARQAVRQRMLRFPS